MLTKQLVNSHNEWDPLKEIIIGISDNLRYPNDDLSMQIDFSFEENGLQNLAITMPPIPDRIIEETREDLEILAESLRNLGVEVKRPEAINTEQKIVTPDWESSQYFNYCPRDTFTIIGDTIIESPNFYRSRRFENDSYREIFLDYFKSGSRWIVAPKPRLREKDFNTNPGSRTILSENEPMFDAANILRAGQDIFYLVSNSGNLQGYTWLKSMLNDEYRVHAFENIYSGVHIDTTVALIRPGLALVNPTRVNDSNLPGILRQWEIVYAPEMQEKTYSDYPPTASKWLGMNLLMVNPNLAIVDADQINLIQLFEKKGIEVLPLKLRHGRSLGGGFHCVTVDTIREGSKESYFI